jgi:hypothetical protein
MNTHDDDRDDRLLEDYRRASHAQAGRPGESTRKAILEGARVAARSRQPAANDARYAWSAAAGIAVLGIALLLWRQSDPRLVATAPVSPAAGRVLSREQPVVAQERQAESAKATSSVAAVQVPAAEARSEAAADVPIDEGARKLRDRFPEAWASPSPPAMVWIVEDAQGNLLRQGTLAAGEPLPPLQSAALSGLARSSNTGAPAADSAGTLQSAPAGWTLRTAVNSSGIPVRIATAREALLIPATPVAPAGVDR